MRAIDLLMRQLDGVNSLYHTVADDLMESEWTARVLPGGNLLGFTLWHLARTQDWTVQTVIRGAPEVISAARRGDNGHAAGMGAGMTLAEADAIARGSTREETLAYADAVHHAITRWLSQLDDAALDEVPDMEGHQAAYAAYKQSAFRTEVEHLAGQPAWRLLTGPCIGHARGHLGEVQALKEALRGQTAR